MEKDEWDDGINYNWLRELTDYWANDFNWNITEDQINAWPNFTTEIDGHTIHFLHIKSKSPNAIPLIISHGWPGSFLEFLKLIPLLTAAEDDVSFDLVIPSLIGFGFSGQPGKEGMSAVMMAGLWVKLMAELGYDKFITQGGDFGAIISTWMGLKHPQHLLGIHLNWIPFSYKPFLAEGETLSDAELAVQKQTAKFFMSEGGYAQIQMTKPLTLSYGLSDSPVALCAWILQIFKSFSDPGKTPDELFDKDELLSHITLYWITKTMYSSMTLYRDMIKEPLKFGKDDFIKVPVGVAKYTYPESFPPRQFVERGYNVQYWREIATGGHFAAMEQPHLFAADLKDFAKTITKG